MHPQKGRKALDIARALDEAELVELLEGGGGCRRRRASV
jgi:hypothetical protein